MWIPDQIVWIFALGVLLIFFLILMALLFLFLLSRRPSDED
jgi:hypothetical protein